MWETRGHRNVHRQARASLSSHHTHGPAPPPRLPSGAHGEPPHTPLPLRAPLDVSAEPPPPGCVGQAHLQALPQRRPRPTWRHSGPHGLAPAAAAHPLPSGQRSPGTGRGRRQLYTHPPLQRTLHVSLNGQSNARSQRFAESMG